MAKINALYQMANVKIDEYEFLAAALTTVPKEYISAIGMEQTRAELEGENFGVDEQTKVMLANDDFTMKYSGKQQLIN